MSDPDDLWRFFLMHSIQFYLFEDRLSLIFPSLEARNKSIFVGLIDSHHYDIDKHDQDDCESGKQFFISENC